VLVNLPDNAIKVSSGRERPGQVALRVVLVEGRAWCATVELIVVDDGIGTDEATQARLFTPFSQADVAANRRQAAPPPSRLVALVQTTNSTASVILRHLHLLGMARSGRERARRSSAGGRAEEPKGRRTSIIVLSANALRGEELRCLAAGVDTDLTKPVPLPRLRAAIGEMARAPAHRSR
jgi:CheY-like chemotaxis protein